MRRGFTLIELLVVIGILAVLAAILFPVFIGSKQASKKTMCLSNMKQIGTSFIMYLSDHDGQYPTCDNDKAKITGRPPDPETPDENGPPERDWTITTQPYMKNFDIFRCASDTSIKPKDPKNPDLVNEYRSSYTVNGWSEYELKESAVSTPAGWVLLAERNNKTRPAKTWWMFYWWSWQPGVWPPAESPDPTFKASQDLAIGRHDGLSNWLFGDGHVKGLAFSKLWKAGKENSFWPNPT